MKYSEALFKFPCKIYRSKDWLEIKEIEEREKSTGTNLDDQKQEPQYAIAYNYIFPEDIRSIEATFSYFKTIDEVIANGCDATRIELKDGRFYTSTWSIDEFLTELDNHEEALQIKIDKERDLRTQQYIDNIRSQLEEKLTPVVQKYQAQGITLKPDLDSMVQEIQNNS